MLKRKTKLSRIKNEVQASSMADIAFLLLIFFLVTTTIVQDKGILVLLPKWEDTPNVHQPKARNIFTILINSNNKLFVRDKNGSITELKEQIKEFITNPNDNPTLSSAPNKAIVSLTHDRETMYASYIEVYNEIKAAYTDLRNIESQKLYDLDFNSLSGEDRQIIKDLIPMIVSEAEPTNYASN